MHGRLEAGVTPCCLSPQAAGCDAAAQMVRGVSVGLITVSGAGLRVPLDSASVGLAAFEGARSPWFVLVREPDHLGVERTHQPLAFGARLVELGEEDRRAPGDDPPPPIRLDPADLRPSRVPRSGDQPAPGSNSSSPSTGAYSR